MGARWLGPPHRFLLFVGVPPPLDVSRQTRLPLSGVGSVVVESMRTHTHTPMRGLPIDRCGGGGPLLPPENQRRLVPSAGHAAAQLPTNISKYAFAAVPDTKPLTQVLLSCSRVGRR